MAFRGVYPAVDLKPTEFGILSGARVMTHSSRDYDERWIRGFSFEYDSQPTVRLLEDGGSSVHTMFDNRPNGVNLPRYLDVKPFFIEVEDFRSTFSLPNEDRFARVLRQLEAVTQKAIERELWNGYVARADATTNQYFTKATAATFSANTPSLTASVQRGLALLEGSLANSPTGEQGVIHLSRDAAAYLGTQWLLMRVEDSPGVFHLETLNGTTCVIGSGYNGNGPFYTVTNKVGTGTAATLTTATAHNRVVGETVDVSGVDALLDGTSITVTAVSGNTFAYAYSGAAVTNAAVSSSAARVQMVGTSTTKWMYASGSLDVHLGKPEVVNDSLADGYDVAGNKNDIRFKALRPVAVHFDPSMLYTVKVNLTA